MANKTLNKKVTAKGPAGKLTDQVTGSARELMLAGLGALSMTRQEGGRLVEQGNRLFDRLVEEGTRFEQGARKDVEGKVTGLRGGVESRVAAVREQASGNLVRLEGLFEERVARVLGRLGVPTADDVNKLSARVEKLSEQVAALADRQGARATSRKAARNAA